MMKKAGLIMVLVTLIFCTFAVGFFLGRSVNNGSIQVSNIPTVSPTQNTEATTVPTEDAIQFPLDINTASVQELTKLQDIGPTLAQRIVDYRNENGPFEALSDLLKVKGIGKKTLEGILDYITIGGQP